MFENFTTRVPTFALVALLTLTALVGPAAATAPTADLATGEVDADLTGEYATVNADSEVTASDLDSVEVDGEITVSEFATADATAVTTGVSPA